MHGFFETLESLGRHVAPSNVRTVSFTLESARVAARDLLSSVTPPVNVFASADLIALGVLEEARALGLEVGRDVRVIGFDDHPWSRERGLSTIHQPVEAMGAAAAELLVERLSGYEGAPRRVRFEPRLIERASTMHLEDGE
jgi:DNA-binding LacI/PurR family transcriptional regulator